MSVDVRGTRDICETSTVKVLFAGTVTPRSESQRGEAGYRANIFALMRTLYAHAQELGTKETTRSPTSDHASAHRLLAEGRKPTTATKLLSGGRRGCVICDCAVRVSASTGLDHHSSSVHPQQSLPEQHRGTPLLSTDLIQPGHEQKHRNSFDVHISNLPPKRISSIIVPSLSHLPY